MKSKGKTLIVSLITLLSLSLILTACSNPKTLQENIVRNDPSASILSSAAARAELKGTDPVASQDLAAARLEFPAEVLESGYNESEACLIQLNGSGAESSKSDGIQIKDNSITLSKAGTYIFSGEWEKGQIIVEAPKTESIQIVLKNAQISNPNGAAIWVKEAKRVTLTLPSESSNRLSSSLSSSNSDSSVPNGTIFSKSDFVVNGKGSLKLEAVGMHGIEVKDDLFLISGNIEINAEKRAISGKDSVRILDGQYILTSSKDAIRSDNESEANKGNIYVAGGVFEITSKGDAIAAAQNLLIEGGTFNVASGGGQAAAPQKISQDPRMGNFRGQFQKQSPAQTPATSPNTTTNSDDTSNKGLKAGANLYISGGKFIIDSADDALHSNGNILIAGGDFSIMAGDDGIHATQSLTIDRGLIIINRSYEGLESQVITINGGEIKITASDDGINASSSATTTSGDQGLNRMANKEAADPKVQLFINGGKIKIQSQGDVIDSNGYLTINGGELELLGAANGPETLIDSNAPALINGGTIIAMGANGQNNGFDSQSKQVVLVYSLPANIGSGTEVNLNNAQNQSLTKLTSSQNFNYLIYSSEKLKLNETYTLNAGNQSLSLHAKTQINGNAATGQGGFGGNKGNKRMIP